MQVSVDRGSADRNGGFVPQIFEPRPVAPLGVWRHGDWTLKAYGIAVNGTPGAPTLPDPLVDEARTHALSCLAEADAEGHHYHLGFVVLHRAVGATWLVTAWWAHDNILCTALSCRTDGAEAFEAWTGPVTACVHEMAVLEFERGAWTTRMMIASPDPDAWAAARMPSGTC